MNREIQLIITAFINLFRLPFKWLVSCGNITFSIIEFISPRAELLTSGKGKLIIGRRCVIKPRAFIHASDGQIVLSNNVFINRNCIVVSKEKIIINEGASIGPNVTIYDHDHVFGSTQQSEYKTSPIIIGKNVWIGTGVIILKGVTIGDNSVIAAGSIITKNVPNDTIVSSKNEVVYREIN